MKLEARIKPTLHETLEKYITLSIAFCFLSFALPMHGKAENDPHIQHIGDLPTYSGKLDLTLLNQENTYEKTHENKAVPQLQAEKEVKAANKEILLSPHSSSSILTTEQGSNLLIVEGSKFPSKYSEYNSSANHSNGFYMNITNPDGSTLNFGTYFNSSSSSDSPRHRSSSQIIVDKIE